MTAAYQDALYGQLLHPPIFGRGGLAQIPEQIKPFSRTLKELRAGVPPEQALQAKTRGLKTYLESYVVRLEDGRGKGNHDTSQCMHVCGGIGHSAGIYCRFCCSEIIPYATPFRYSIAFRHFLSPNAPCRRAVNETDRKTFVEAIAQVDAEARGILERHQQRLMAGTAVIKRNGAVPRTFTLRSDRPTSDTRTIRHSVSVPASPIFPTSSSFSLATKASSLATASPSSTLADQPSSCAAAATSSSAPTGTTLLSSSQPPRIASSLPSSIASPSLSVKGKSKAAQTVSTPAYPPASSSVHSSARSMGMLTFKSRKKTYSERLAKPRTGPATFDEILAAVLASDTEDECDSQDSAANKRRKKLSNKAGSTPAITEASGRSSRISERGEAATEVMKPDPVTAVVRNPVKHQDQSRAAETCEDCEVIAADTGSMERTATRIKKGRRNKGADKGSERRPRYEAERRKAEAEIGPGPPTTATIVGPAATVDDSPAVTSSAEASDDEGDVCLGSYFRYEAEVVRAMATLPNRPSNAINHACEVSAIESAENTARSLPLQPSLSASISSLSITTQTSSSLTSRASSAFSPPSSIGSASSSAATASVPLTASRRRRTAIAGSGNELFPPSVLPFVTFLKSNGIRDLTRIKGEISVSQIDSYVRFLSRRFPGQLDVTSEFLLCEALKRILE